MKQNYKRSFHVTLGFIFLMLTGIGQAGLSFNTTTFEEELSRGYLAFTSPLHTSENVQQASVYFALLQSGVVTPIDSKGIYNHQDIHDRSQAQHLSGKPVCLVEGFLCHSVDTVFLEALRQFKPSTTSDIKYLTAAYNSGAFKSHPTAKHLYQLAKAISYGSAIQSGLYADTYNHLIKNYLLNYAGQYPAYFLLRWKKPHIADFLYGAWKASATPLAYNLSPQAHSEFLYSFSCTPHNQDVANYIKLLESCKLSDAFYKTVDIDKKPLTDSIESSPFIKKVTNLMPTAYAMDFEDQEGFKGLRSLDYLLGKIISDNVDGAMYMVFFQGHVKYQFFTVGISNGYLNLTYVVDNNEPTPVLNFSYPLERVKSNRQVVVDGIHAMLNQDKENERNLVPDLLGVWLMTGR